jgi:hypothetical protein
MRAGVTSIPPLLREASFPGDLVRSRSVTITLCVAVLSAGGAVGCYVRSSELKREAGWLLERGNAQAAEYASTFDGAIAEAQLKTFEARRLVLDRAHLWQRGQMLLILVTVIAALSGYLLFLFHRLRADLEHLGPEAVPSPSPANHR